MPDNALHRIARVNVEQQGDQDAPLLVLEDERGRRCEMVIGLCEYMAIQLALHKTEFSRPFTHDLLVSLAEHLETAVERVIVDDISNGTYYARLILTDADGTSISLDCRPSDAIAVALRTRAPIEASDAVILGEDDILGT